MDTPNKKLSLETEAVSELSEDQLSNVAGGTDGEAASYALSAVVGATATSLISGVIGGALSGALTRHHSDE